MFFSCVFVRMLQYTQKIPIDFRFALHGIASKIKSCMYEIYKGFQTVYRLSKLVDILAEALKHIFKDFLGIIHSFYLEDNYQFEYF